MLSTPAGVCLDRQIQEANASGKPGPDLGACMRAELFGKADPHCPLWRGIIHPWACTSNFKSSKKAARCALWAFPQTGLISRPMCHAGCRSSSKSNEVCCSDCNAPAWLSLHNTPKHCAATSTTRLKLVATGRAPEYDGMIKASLERRHHVQRNDFTHFWHNVQQPLWNMMGKGKERRKREVFLHKIGVRVLV